MYLFTEEVGSQTRKLKHRVIYFHGENLALPLCTDASLWLDRVWPVSSLSIRFRESAIPSLEWRKDESLLQTHLHSQQIFLFWIYLFYYLSFASIGIFGNVGATRGNLEATH